MAMIVHDIHLLSPGDYLDCPCQNPFKIEELRPEAIIGWSFCHPERRVVLTVIKVNVHSEVMFPCFGRCRNISKSPN